MPIAIKAVHDFSATAAVATAWTVTASTSIAIGDTLILALSWLSSTSGSAATPIDNAGNVWTSIGQVLPGGGGNGRHAAWWAPVTTTTANFQIAIGTEHGKTVSGRAAHLLVLSGAHATEPIDAGSVKNTTEAGSSATFTASTSATTTLDAGMLIAHAFINGAPSASYNADAAWTMQGAAIEANAVQQQIWTRSIAAPAIYGFSASVSVGGTARNKSVFLFAIRAAAADASASGTATLTFAPTGTLAGLGNMAGVAAMSFTAQAEATSASASLPTAATLLGGGWDRRLFRKLLEVQRLRLQARAEALGARGETVGTPDAGRPARAIAGELAALSLAPQRQMWRLREQARLVAMLEQSLSTLDQAIAREEREREAEELLLLAA